MLDAIVSNIYCIDNIAIRDSFVFNVDIKNESFFSNKDSFVNDITVLKNQNITDSFLMFGNFKRDSMPKNTVVPMVYTGKSFRIVMPSILRSTTYKTPITGKLFYNTRWVVITSNLNLREECFVSNFFINSHIDSVKDSIILQITATV